MINLHGLLEQYEIGNVTALEVAYHFVKNVNKENAVQAARLLEECPDVEARVKENVQKYIAMSDEDRAKLIKIRSWCGPWNDEIKKRVEESDLRDKELYRIGAFALHEAWKE